MSSFFSPFKVGLLVLVTGVSFVYFSANLKKNMKEEGNYIVNLYLDDATGLSKRARVLTAGIAIGEIKDIKLSEKGDKAKVSIIVKKDIVLHSDATALKKNSSILGDSYIELTPGFKGELLKNGDRITNIIEAASMGNVINKFDQIAADVKDMTHELKNIIANPDTTSSVKNTLKNLEDIMTKFNNVVTLNNSRINSIVKNIESFSKEIQNMPKIYDKKLSSLIDNMDNTVLLMKNILKNNEDKFNKIISSTDNLLNNENIDNTFRNVENISKNLSEVSNNIKKGKGSLGKFLNSDRLYNKVGDVIESTSNFVKNFSDLKTIVVAESNLLMNKKAGLHSFGIKFVTRPNKFYYFGVSSSPFGVLTEDKRIIEGGAETTKRTYEQKLSLDIQLAFKYYFMTFRYGIFESTAGVGIDFTFFDNSIVFTSRVNDFVEDKPNLRLDLKFYPFKYVYLNAGALHLFNSEKRDYFIGLGTSFNDRDLKSILTIAPKPAF